VRHGLAIVMVIWLGLVSAASPALACASSHRDCCPEGMTSPCDGKGSVVDLSTIAAVCCVSAPAASSAAAESPRATHVQPHDLPSLDPIATFAWLATFTASDHECSPRSHDISVAPTDEGLTYLRTLRLRL